MTTVLKVNVPNAGQDETAHTILGDVESPRWKTRGTEDEPRILFVRIQHDQDCQHPLKDCDGMGSIRALGHRDTEDTITKEEFLALVGPLNDEELLERAFEALEGNPQPWDHDAVVLSKFEHGLVLWSVCGTMHGGNTPDWQWDGTPIAGVWTPDDALVDEVKGLTASERRAKMEEFAQQACDEYTKWCNGDCYGYDVRLYKYRAKWETEFDEYETAKPLAEESCWGFIGSEYVEQEARSVAEHMVREEE